MRINQNLERSSTLVSKLSLYHVSKLTPKSVSPSWQRDNDSLQSKSNRSPPSIFPPPSSQSGHGPESDHLQEESLKREGERERVSFICLRVSDPYRALFEIFRGNFLLQTWIVAVGIRPIPWRRRLPGGDEIFEKIKLRGNGQQKVA